MGSPVTLDAKTASFSKVSSASPTPFFTKASVASRPPLASVFVFFTRARTQASAAAAPCSRSTTPYPARTPHRAFPDVFGLMATISTPGAARSRHSWSFFAFPERTITAMTDDAGEAPFCNRVSQPGFTMPASTRGGMWVWRFIAKTSASRPPRMDRVCAPEGP
jgi:hypothetical protein